MAKDKVHPTKRLLLETAIDLIDEFGPQGFTVEKVLETSGISKGSLYHHYVDFDDLIDQAQIVRYGRAVDEDLTHIIEAIRKSKSRDDFLSRVKGIVDYASSENRVRDRSNRALILGSSWGKPEFRRALGEEQKRLTDAFVDLQREMAERGWIKPKFSPVAIATFIQAYAFGRLIDDVLDERVDTDEWGELVAAVIGAILSPA